jgi:hypothetical protein
MLKPMFDLGPHTFLASERQDPVAARYHAGLHPIPQLAELYDLITPTYTDLAPIPARHCDASCEATLQACKGWNPLVGDVS